MLDCFLDKDEASLCRLKDFIAFKRTCLSRNASSSFLFMSSKHRYSMFVKNKSVVLHKEPRPFLWKRSKKGRRSFFEIEILSARESNNLPNEESPASGQQETERKVEHVFVDVDVKHKKFALVRINNKICFLITANSTQPITPLIFSFVLAMTMTMICIPEIFI